MPKRGHLPERKVQTHVYLTTDEAKELQMFADKGCRSLTQQIRFVLLEWLSKAKP